LKSASEKEGKKQNTPCSVPSLRGRRGYSTKGKRKNRAKDDRGGNIKSYFVTGGYVENRVFLSALEEIFLGRDRKKPPPNHRPGNMPAADLSLININAPRPGWRSRRGCNPKTNKKKEAPIEKGKSRHVLSGLRGEVVAFVARDESSPVRPVLVPRL
jgi:hypothetical protein